MNKTFSVFIVCLLFLGSIACQEKINSGLVAYYPFDGDVNDYSGYGNHGVVDRVVPAADRFGNENSAYSFDGIKGNILASVQGIPALNSALSFSWWFWIDTEPVFQDEWGAGNMIALVDTSDGIGTQVGFRAPAYRSLGLDTWMWGGETLLEVKIPDQNVWHHCVYTFDGNTHRFFLNGKEMTKSTVPSQKGILRQLMFGNYPSGDQYFKGKMDDIRIYNRALSESEIKNLYIK
jgi:hypothetical protein